MGAKNWQPYFDALREGPKRVYEIRDVVFGRATDTALARCDLLAAHQALRRMFLAGVAIRPGYGYYALPEHADEPVNRYQSFEAYFGRHRGGMTIADIQERFGVSYHTARHYVERYKRLHGIRRTMEKSDSRGKPRRYWTNRKPGRKPKVLRQAQQAA